MNIRHKLQGRLGNLRITMETPEASVGIPPVKGLTLCCVSFLLFFSQTLVLLAYIAGDNVFHYLELFSEIPMYLASCFV